MSSSWNRPLRTLGVMIVSLAVPVLGVSFTACNNKNEAADLTSLRRSGEVTFLCINQDREGAPMVDCPQGARTDDNGLTVGSGGYQIYALVTQTLSAEVAVIRVTGRDSSYDADGKVLDVDPTNPGVTPLRIGGQAAGIATSPGGLASFVGVAEPGRPGLFGIPTSCIFEPKDGETRRDVTTWPACSLPSRPGAVEVLVDHEPRRFCGAAPQESYPYAAKDAECITDLSRESIDPGSRKLVVSLPDEGKLVIVDAQDLLDRQRGTFAPCFIEAEIPLNGRIPPKLAQPLPPDMVGEGTGNFQYYPEIAGEYSPQPSGMDALEGNLLVADKGGPLVHLLDAREPCDLSELEPLIATSYETPDRFVTTSRVAVSPLTQSGQRFVYTIDEKGDELASVIAFEVSAGASSRLPLLREGSPLVSFEAPDRLEFAAAVKDVGFAALDAPYIDPVTGESVTGVLCDPNPSTSSSSLGALYRPSSDDAGARPLQLRGTFGYALLSSGRLAVIDIEDFDAPCRRPKEVNTSSELDSRGCANDPDIGGYFTADREENSTPTVTDESTCRVVIPHRARSGVRIITEEGEAVQSPSLRSFGRLALWDRGLSLNRQTVEGKRRPILLGVGFPGAGGADPQPAFVYVGNTKYASNDATDPFDIDPNSAERSAPVLPFIEPRAYPQEETVTVSYEGDIDRERLTGKLSAAEPDGTARLTDDSRRYCDRGLQDRALTQEVGRSHFGLSSGALERFTERYTDYVQITNLLFDEGDAYWRGAGANCQDGGQTFSGEGYALCASVFGIGEEDDLNVTRDFTVVEASADELVLAARRTEDVKLSRETLDLLSCCFPAPLTYRVRAGNQWVVQGSASGFGHAVREDDEGHCEFDTAPLSQYQKGRVFEVASTGCDTVSGENPSCGVGLWSAEDVVCAYDGSGPVEVGGPASECIFDGINRRFVVYRGLDPSERGMAFTFDVAGGFRGMSISLAGSSSSNVLPVSMTFLPEFGALGVVDAQDQGLMMVDLPNSRVAARFF